MKIAQHVQYAIDDYEQSKLLSALLHACAAVDGTGSKLFPKATVRDRFVGTIDRYLWLVEPMLALGVNLSETVFTWITLERRQARFSEIVYEIFRCNLAHGTEVPAGFSVELRQSDRWRSFFIAQQQAVLPDTIIFALLSIAVFSSVNANQRINAGYYLSHDATRFVIDEWWGKEADVQPFFAQMAIPRVTMKF